MSWSVRVMFHLSPTRMGLGTSWQSWNNVTVVGGVVTDPASVAAVTQG